MNQHFDTHLQHQYQEQGYVLFHNQLFGPEKFARLSGIMEEHLAEKGSKLSDELDTPHFRDARLFEFLMADEALDLVQALIGPNVGLWSSHFICKEPFTGRRTPWHEDSAYWKGKFQRLDKIVTLWLALDDSTLENGCMGVVPGTHHNGFSSYVQADSTTSTFDTEIDPALVDVSKVVWFELKKGEASFHDSRIIHGANANSSPRRRCGYTMRYFSLDMPYNADYEGNKGHRIYHCRGKNLANNPLTYL